MYQHYLEAVRIMRRAELVLATGWTFRELDDQDRAEVNELLLYQNIKAGVEAEQEAMRS